MAMFARRSVQRMLNHLGAHLPAKARTKLAHELNQQSASALGFEWETALLFAFCHLGKVEYEAGGATQPDITFVGDAQNPISFAADIATVSDEGLEKENPTVDLSLALIRLRQKYDLPGSTYCKIGGEATGKHFRDRKMRLKLPPRQKIAEFLKKHVAPQFRRARDEKLQTITATINEPGVEVTVTYNANQRFGGLSYPSYAAAYSLTHNPVYPKLKKKIDQLKKSALKHPFGVFLCDGGCTLLKTRHGPPHTVTITDVVNEIFRLNSSVGFVAILTFPPPMPGPFFGAVKKEQIEIQLVRNNRAKNPINESALQTAIKLAFSHVPPPITAAHEALNWIASADAHTGMPIHNIAYGGSLMSQSLTISARKIQEVLAGRMTPKQLFDQHAQPNSSFENQFAKALKQGLTIQSVTLTKIPEADDDILEFRFGPDAAIKKFEPNKG